MDKIDRTWRLSIIAILAGSLLVIGVLAFIVVPVVGAGDAGLDAFTAICRAIGINLGKTAPALRTAGQASETKVAWTAPEFAALAHADRAAGEMVAQATCVACHAVDGSSPDPAIPRMVGQSPFATYKQLQDFKSGARKNDAMSQIVASLKPKEMADVAAYYAGLRRSDLDAAHPSFAGSDIQNLAMVGDPGRALAPCAACHSTGAGGPIETPGLIGQSSTYVAAQLQGFADGSRHNDVYERMRSIAAKLSPREMVLLGAFYTTPH
jgi:cytochrome c553